MRIVVALAAGVLAAAIVPFPPAQAAGPFSGETFAAAPSETKGSVVKTAAAFDIGDVWWPDAEPGWGIQFVQNGGLVFATMYVYGAGGAPTFYVAVLENTPAGSGTFAGAVYSTTGSPYNVPWNPASVVETEVGTMTFTQTDPGVGTLVYTIGATSVTKTIHRQALRLEDNSGDYVMVDAFASLSSSASCAASGVQTSLVHIAQTGSTATAQIIWGGVICNFPLAYTQRGRIGKYVGTMACSSGDAADVVFDDVQNTPTALTGRYTFVLNTGCSFEGNFAATKRP